MAKKFANLEGFTQSYPAPKGGSVCFSPGQAREGHWWSRFKRPGGLTEVPGDYNPSKDFKPFGPKRAHPVVTPRIVGETMRVNTGCRSRCDSSCQIACENKCELACEGTKQTIHVTEHHEKVGVDLYCRHCDWSTREPKRVEEHMEAYHPDLLKSGPVAEVNSGTWSESQHAEDPGPEATTSGTGDRAVPSQGSPPPRPAVETKKENPRENDHWEIVDGVFKCLKCKENANINWSTPTRSAMARHAKRYHGYETETDKKKKKKAKVK